MPHYQLRIIVAIEERPIDDPIQHSRIVERLFCGHDGIDHVATYKHWDGPLHYSVDQFAHLIGRKRNCRTCERLAALGKERLNA